jgi:hypothetical protein
VLLAVITNRVFTDAYRTDVPHYHEFANRLHLPESGCRFLVGGIPIRGGIATARDAARTHRARAAGGEPRRPGTCLITGRCDRMNHGFTMSRSANGFVPLAVSMVVARRCEQIP